MFCKFKKMIAQILIGLGIGIILVILLPPDVWIIIFGVAVTFCGIKMLLG